MPVDPLAEIDVETMARMLTPGIAGERDAEAAHILCRNSPELIRSRYWELVEIERLVCTEDYTLSWELWCDGRELWEGHAQHLEVSSAVNDSRLRHRGLAAVAIRESRRAVAGTAAEAQRCAGIAVAAIEGYLRGCGAIRGGQETLALALGEQANAQRLDSHALAALTLEKAQAAGARRGSTLALLHELSMVLHRDCRSFDDAIREGEKSLKLWNKEDDPHCEATARTILASVYSEKGEPELAMTEVRRALPDLDPLRDPTAVPRAHLGEALILVELGRHAEALTALDQVEPGEDRRMEARKAWIRGRALLAAGHLREARKALAQGQQIFETLGDLKNQVLVSAEDLVILREMGTLPGLDRQAASLASVLEILEWPREAQLARAVARNAGGATLRQVVALQEAIAAAVSQGSARRPSTPRTFRSGEHRMGRSSA